MKIGNKSLYLESEVRKSLGKRDVNFWITATKVYDIKVDVIRVNVTEAILTYVHEQMRKV